METHPFARGLHGELPRNLLPIREAYEWKRAQDEALVFRKLGLLPIREAYEWKLY